MAEVWTRVGEIVETWTRVSDVDTSNPDTTPTSFSFSAVTNATRETVYQATMTVLGIDPGVELVVSVEATGLTGEYGYSIEGGALTTAPGVAVLNDDITVQITTNNTFAAVQDLELFVGSVSAVFRVTNTAADGYVAALDFSDPRNSQYLVIPFMGAAAPSPGAPSMDFSDPNNSQYLVVLAA